MRSLIRFFATFFIFSFFQSASAEDYYWQYTSGTDTGVSKTAKYTSPEHACSATASRFPTTTYIVMSYLAGPVDQSFQSQCTINLAYSWDPTVKRAGAYPVFIRRGDSCPADYLYNSESGQCEPPLPNECEEKAGDSSKYYKSGDIGDGYLSIVTIGGKKLHVSPNDACMGGCAVVVQSNCIPTISTNRYRCTGDAYYTGTSCTASNDAPQVEQEENYVPDEPKNTEIKEPCIYVPDAQGAMRCVSKESLEKEGQHCGEYNGKSFCAPKEATTDEKTVQTEVTETAEPDGGKKIVKKDTATVTKCTGSNNNCTTTTTTTTTTSKSDGSGATTSTTVECKGKDCGSGTGGGGAGNGSGSGEGEEGEEGGELEGQDEVAGFGESLQDFNSRISGAPILASVSSISMPRGGSCSMGSASVPLLGSISFNWVCQNANVLNPLYYVMLAVWAIAAVRVFLEA